jgi:hypothetical protein
MAKMTITFPDPDKPNEPIKVQVTDPLMHRLFEIGTIHYRQEENYYIPGIGGDYCYVTNDPDDDKIHAFPTIIGAADFIMSEYENQDPTE